MSGTREERRRWPRAHANLRVSVQPEGSGAGFTTRSLDASIGGIFLACQPPMLLGKRVTLEIHLAKERVRCTARGVVMRAVLRSGRTSLEGSGIFIEQADDEWASFCARFPHARAAPRSRSEPPV